MKSVRVVITGRVQGVWFRAWTTEQAVGLGLSGWVKNRPDGVVEAVLSGPDEAVDQILEKLWQGPPLARVAGVSVIPCQAPGEAGFRPGMRG